MTRLGWGDALYVLHNWRINAGEDLTKIHVQKCRYIIPKSI
jgi:hypothetical protein